MSGDADDSRRAGGLLASVRRVAVSMLALVQTRLDLFAVELQEEKLRSVALLRWIVVGLALLGTGILVTIGTLALYLWRTFGYGGLIALAVALLGGATTIFALVRRRLRQGPQPFSATVAEFKKDIAWLRRD